MIRLAFKGKPETKARLVARMDMHYEQDNIVKNSGYVTRDWRQTERPVTKWAGCAVTCLTRDSITKSTDNISQGDLYKAVNRLLNIPYIAVVIDVVHEATDIEDKFNIKLLEQLRVDVDYSGFVMAFCYYLGMLPSRFQEKFLKELSGGRRRSFVDTISFYVDYNIKTLEEKYSAELLSPHKVNKDYYHKVFFEFLEKYNSDHLVENFINAT